MAGAAANGPGLGLLFKLLLLLVLLLRLLTLLEVCLLLTDVAAPAAVLPVPAGPVISMLIVL
jgi:hypothetical protein